MLVPSRWASLLGDTLVALICSCSVWGAVSSGEGSVAISSSDTDQGVYGFRRRLMERVDMCSLAPGHRSSSVRACAYRCHVGHWFIAASARSALPFALCLRQRRLRPSLLWRGAGRSLHMVAEASSGSAAHGRGDELELELVPHEGFVALDDLGDRCQITHTHTHTTTLEKLVCPGGGWSLVFDEDGFGVAVPPSDSALEAKVLERDVRFALHRSHDGSLYIVGVGLYAGQVTCLSSMMQKCEQRDVEIVVGIARTSRRFEAAAFKWPRTPGARFFWSAKSVYEELGFDQLSGH